MLIGIDASRAVVAQRTGTEAYSLHLIRALLEHAPAHRFRLYLNAPAPAGLWRGAQCELRSMPFPRLWTHVRLSAEMLRQPPDVLFVPSHVLPLIHPRRSVVTVHDLGHRYYPEAHTLGQRRYLEWSTRYHVRTAAHLLADSYATRDDLLRLYGASSERVTVAHLGVDPALRPAHDAETQARVRQRYGIDGEYVLYVGTLQPRKNLVRLIEAFGAVVNAGGAGPRATLVLAGKRGWLYDAIVDKAREQGVAGRVVLPGFVDEADLGALYSGATLFVMPSLYEGFCMPVLEAMTCGTPVACSNVSSLPEVVGDAALTFDPHDVRAIARAIERALVDDHLRAQCAARGRLRAAAFTWQACAQRVNAVLEEVAGERQGGGARSGGARSGGARSGGAQSGGARSGGAQSGGAQSGGARSGGAQSGGARSGGARSGAGQAASATDGLRTTGGRRAGPGQVHVHRRALEDEMLRIDTHIHYIGDHPDCLALLNRLDLKLLNVSVAHGPGDPWREHDQAYHDLAAAHPERYAWCTTFDPPEFTPDYAERVISELEADFGRGAIACKIWKNVGMDARTPSGAFLLVDDPLFDPIYAYLARAGRTLLMHIGEPLACWQPLTEDNLHRGYYGAHPEWHMYNKPEFPSHQELIDARDRVLVKHPTLRVVGAHLGSLEYDVGEIARRLERYPNFAVDSSARTRDLAYQDGAKVRAFFAAYPDRVLFGTDLVIRTSHVAMDAAERQRNLERVVQVYERESAYYERDGVTVQGGQEVLGLGLPEDILQRFYRDNAARWYPGIV